MLVGALTELTNGSGLRRKIKHIRNVTLGIRNFRDKNMRNWTRGIVSIAGFQWAKSEVSPKIIRISIIFARLTKSFNFHNIIVYGSFDFKGMLKAGTKLS